LRKLRARGCLGWGQYGFGIASETAKYPLRVLRVGLRRLLNGAGGGQDPAQEQEREREQSQAQTHERAQHAGNLSLLELLHRDRARQCELEGRPEAGASAAGLLRRLLHPRFLPIVLCRCSRTAMLAGIPALPGLLTYLNLVVFGLEVTPKCEIGPGIFFPHPAGTVVGAWRIGRNATILQGVTLGAQRMDLRFDKRLRPELGDNVTVGAGAKVLGGIRIGDDATVGANAVVVEAVEAGSTVVGIPARPLGRDRRRRPAGDAAAAAR
jgi:serine O-acetyltransferase